jgi:type II secretory pathway pseudopilin PulG
MNAATLRIKSTHPGPSFTRVHNGAFSLVEVTVAIGIFAFVAVGVLGLMPAALRQRAEAALDTRSVLIAEELFASVRAAPSVTNVTFRDGPGLRPGNNRTVNLTNRPAVLGYPSQTTVPFWSFDRNPGGSWTNAGGTDAEVTQSAVNTIETLARLSASNVGGNLYQVTVEVRSPASLPLTNTRPNIFTAFVYSP